MTRRISLVLALLLVACQEESTAPAPAMAPPPALAFSSIDEDRGPPSPYPFGPDHYRIGPPFTGEGLTGLDCSFSSETVRDCRGFLRSDVDGTLLDVTLQRPQGDGPFPLVALVHGYAGSKTSSGDIASRLISEGYAVLRYSTRGFGQSWGQVNMSDIHAEIGDLRSMIGQVADDPANALRADAVAVTGASYGGGHSWLALVTPTFTSAGGTPVQIRTVIPIAPWTDLLYSLIPNGRERRSVDRPGGLKLSYVNGLYGSGIRRNPARPYPNYPDYFIAWHAWINAMEPTAVDPVYGSIVDGLAGYRSIWWQQQFWQSAATARVPIFQVQGLTDDLFPLPEAKRMLLALQSIDPTYPIATYLGDLGHPRASNKTGEVDHVLDLLTQWLGFYLKGEGTEPPHVIYAAVTRPREEPFNPANIITVGRYEDLSTAVLTTAFRGTTVLVNPAADPLAGFVWDPLVLEASHELQPLPAPPDAPLVANSLGVHEVDVSALSGGSDILIAGQPLVHLRARGGAPRVQLNVRLFDVAPDGTRQLITRGTYTLDNVGSPIVLSDPEVTIPTYGNVWRAPAGHRLRLEITNVDSPYITPSRVPSVTVVSRVRLEIPVR